MLPLVSTTGRSSTPNVEELVKDFVATRPRRPRSGRVVAGVAAGIGRRYGVDPVIIRVALVVSAIYGGAGVLFYLVAWLLLAAQGDQVSPLEALLGRGRSSTSRGLTLVLCIALIPATSFVFGGHYSTLAGVVVLLGALYLLHRYRGDQGQIDATTSTMTNPEAGTMTDSPPTTGATDRSTGTNAGPQDAVPNSGVSAAGVSAAGASTTGVSTADASETAPLAHDGSTDGARTDDTRADYRPEYPPIDHPVADAAPTDRVAPPAWDPLGAAPFAWDLPEPAPAVPEPLPVPVRQHRSRAGLATLGVMFVTGAVLAVLSQTSDWLNAPHIVGILGAIAGIGLVVGAFVRSGRGLIPLALLLAVAGFGLTNTHIDGWHGAGDTTFRPTTITDVQKVYQRSVGDITLDLTDLPNTGVVDTSVNLGVGNLTVLVPAGAKVTATCEASVGDVSCLGQHTSGPGNPTVHASQHADATDSRLNIVLHVQDGPGQVEVTSNG
jgi:phage shock protein PspC (stress-responsive transcriptional regulator)